MNPKSIPGYLEYKKQAKPKVPNDHFVALLARNVNNQKLTDTDFREFVRNCLEVVEG